MRTCSCCADSSWESGWTAPSWRMIWRLAASRDRFCTAPAADPAAASDLHAPRLASVMHPAHTPGASSNADQPSL